MNVGSANYMRCDFCYEPATVRIELLGRNFCNDCLKKIDARIAEINSVKKDVPATVSQLIAKLSDMPQDAPVYVRPKYHGDLAWYEDAAVVLDGISEMHPNGKPKNVTLLV